MSPFTNPTDGRRLVRCHLLAGQFRAGCAKHHAKCDAKGHANDDSHGYVLHGRTQCGSETQTQTNADTGVFHKIPRAKSATLFLDRPNVIRDVRLHCGRHAKCLVDTPEVVTHKIECDSGYVALDLLAEGVRHTPCGGGATNELETVLPLISGNSSAQPHRTPFPVPLSDPGLPPRSAAR
jgi:hypothetical protein